ncbi:MAG: efflux RND transporter permease subunit [Algisphaera sp.]
MIADSNVSQTSKTSDASNASKHPEGLIAKLIRSCIANRGLVLLLAALLAAAGVWSARHITVDAIPDLSDVQVVVRTDYMGQAPQIVQDQVTYPLTTAMLAVPKAKVVRGYSMFGTSFVYILFEDNTDLYWARSRVLEQLSVVSAQLPKNVTPQLGPDATAVGWVYQYVLNTGPYCPTHPQGLWHDENADSWYADSSDAPPHTTLTHQRFFPAPETALRDPQTGAQYTLLADAPPPVHDRLQPITLRPGFTACPLDDTPLVEPQVDLAQLRSLQDWFLRYELTAVKGVSEVAAIGGFVKQYQVTVDPNRLLAYDISLAAVRDAVRRSNQDVGAKLIERGETEFMVRGLGYLGGNTPQGEDPTPAVLSDLRQIALSATANGTPVYLRDVAQVTLGPDIRRGVAEWNGRGETVGGVVLMRFGENARDTIDRVRKRLSELEQGLPPGVAIEVAYDRSDLIERAVSTVAHTLLEEVLVVGVVILIFLMHARSALVAACVLPMGVLFTLTVMNAFKINANIMSLGGIAISIGVMVDSSIVMVENVHFRRSAQKRLSKNEGNAPHNLAHDVANAAVEVGPTLFFSLLIVAVSFLPILVLGGQSGRLFAPLALTKTIAMAAAAILAVTLIPVLLVYFMREDGLKKRWAALIALVVGIGLWVTLKGPFEEHAVLIAGSAAIALLLLLPRQRLRSEHENPISRLLRALYEPFFHRVMRFRMLTLVAALALMASTLFPWSQLGSEFMPPLEEGDLLYMPVTDPGISVDRATQLLQQTDALIRQFPEVKSVLGKIGRADTATDPAPISMLETTIALHRDKQQWRSRPVDRFYSTWPRVLAWLPSHFFSDTRPITPDELVYGYTLPAALTGGSRDFHVPGLNDALQIPGLANAWTLPIRTRIDMLSTGIRTPVGIKIMGDDLATLAQLSEDVASLLQTDPRTRDHLASAFPDKTVGGHYLDININRAAIARYGLTIDDVQDVIGTAMGGMTVTQTVEGQERYAVNVRYPRELRHDIQSIKQVLVATPRGVQVPLGQLATIQTHRGPPMIKSENARLTSWVYVDIQNIDIGTFVKNAKAAVAQSITLPPGVTLVWSGQYEYMQAARARLQVALPLAALAIVLLLFAATRSWLRVAIVLLAVPFSLIGAAWFVWFLDYDLSLAVWVGVIALAGLDAETGLVMLLYLDDSFKRFSQEGRMNTPEDLRHAIHDGAVQRIRPKTMTVMTTFIGLLPLLWATGAGADTMRRLAAPMIGGLATSFIAELLLYPVIFYSMKHMSLRHQFHASQR